MQVDLIFSPSESNRIQNLKEKTVVVIDVLRATSSMLYAFNAFDNYDTGCLKGVNSIMPVRSVQEAYSTYKKSKDQNILLSGEVDGFKPEGFHLGNSPKDFLSETIAKKKLIMATTNGTMTLNLFKGKSKRILIGAFLNAKAAANMLISLHNDVLIACAGTELAPGIEDITCGGYIVDLLKFIALEKSIKINLSDSAKMSVIIFKSYSNTLDILNSSKHGQSLIKKGFNQDIQLCARNNLFNFVPVLKENKLYPEKVFY